MASWFAYQTNVGWGIVMPGDTVDFEAVFKALPGKFLLLDRHLRIIEASDGYLMATMTKRGEIMGRQLFDVFPDNPEALESNATLNLSASLRHVLEFRESHTMPIQRYDIRRPDGAFEERSWSPTNAPVLDEFGEVSLIVHRVEDVTEMVRLYKVESEGKDTSNALQVEKQERRVAENDLEQFFSLSLDLLCISSEDGYFKRLSPAFSVALGWSVEELLARPFVEFIHPADIQPTLEAVERQVNLGEVIYQFENRYRHKDGSWRVLSWKSIPQPGGLMFATARDVTSQKIMDLEINELNRALVKRAEELEQMRQVADRANAAKSEFLSRMSHELRTPLNSILGFAQLLEMRSVDTKSRESGEAILKAGRHLLGLINEVLDLARIEARKLVLSLEPVSLQASVSLALEMVRSMAEYRGIDIQNSVDADDEIYVSADRQRLTQVFINVLSNAIKYNKENGEIWVSPVQAEGDRTWIEVSDSGQGIREEDQRLLFVPFERIGSGNVEGTGLGLALSKNLMELMGGSLTLVKSSLEGSTFRIEMVRSENPFLGASWTNILEPQKHTEPKWLLRVVYIEDNDSNLLLMQSMVEAIGGIELKSARQASTGKRLVQEQMPDVVLLDLHLPDGHGIDVLRDLKADSRTAQIPIVVISADATQKEHDRLMEAGARSYLTKPVELQALISELNHLRAEYPHQTN